MIFQTLCLTRAGCHELLVTRASTNLYEEENLDTFSVYRSKLFHSFATFFKVSNCLISVTC